MSNISASNEEAVDMDALDKAFAAVEAHDLSIGEVFVREEDSGSILDDLQAWKEIVGIR
jgi:hypothetical protein